MNRKNKHHAVVRGIIQCKINILNSTCLGALSRDSSDTAVASVDLIGERESSFQSIIRTVP